MLSLLAVLFGLAMAPQEAASATYISAADVEASLQQSIAAGTVDRLIQGTDVHGHKLSVAILRRTKPEANALVHERATEIYQVMEGAGTLVTGGTLVDPKPNDLTRLGAGPSQSGTPKGGDSRRIGPKDIIIIPAGTPHRFSQLDGTITYLVYRVDPGAGTAAK